MSGIGHNNGPTMEAGFAWRKHSWTRARAELIPTLPIEILRRRVARAKEVGLSYKTYASIRAASGHDVVAFLFSSNALRVLRAGQAMPGARAGKLEELADTGLAALTQPPLRPTELEEGLRALHGLSLDAVEAAPRFDAPWSEIRAAVQAPLRAARLPKDGVVVVGDTVAESEWCAATKLAGFVPSDRYFAPLP